MFGDDLNIANYLGVKRWQVGCGNPSIRGARYRRLGRERHRQGQSDKADRYSGYEVASELIDVVVTKTENGFRKPAFFACGRHHARLRLVGRYWAGRWVVRAIRKSLN
jgi:hypothetical protein